MGPFSNQKPVENNSLGTVYAGLIIETMLDVLKELQQPCVYITIINAGVNFHILGGVTLTVYNTGRYTTTSEFLKEALVTYMKGPMYENEDKY